MASGEKKKKPMHKGGARRALRILLKSIGVQGSSVVQSRGSEPDQEACFSSFKDQLSGLWEKLSPLNLAFLKAWKLRNLPLTRLFLGEVLDEC